MKLFSLLLLSLFVILSCSKESEDAEPPVVTFISPNNSDVFTAGQMIHIKGTVTDNNYVDEIHIEISNLITGEEYDHIHIHPGSKTYSFDQSFTVKAATRYKIKVIAEDPSSNSSSGVLEISSN
ncbi:MAG: DUF4625 domain-containing protein [Chitinophagaceae bacterium]